MDLFVYLAKLTKKYFKDKVIQPRKTIVEYELKPSDSHRNTVYEKATITLEDDLEDNISIITKNYNKAVAACSSNASSCTSTATNAMALIAANIQFQSSTNGLTSSSSMSSSASPQLLNSSENVWKNRNLENSVIIPETSIAKSKIKN